MDNGLLQEIFRNRELIVSLEAKLNHVINILMEIPIKPEETQCPVCMCDVNKIDKKEERCWNCGQRLKWSE